MGNPWDADVEFSDALARSLIDAQFPELRGFDVSALGCGWDNAAYLVGGEWVFRFPQRKVAGELMSYESRSLPHLARGLTLPVPNPVFHGEPAPDYPYPFVGYRRLEGDPASDVDLTDSSRVAMAGTLGRFLRALRTFPIGRGTATVLRATFLGEPTCGNACLCCIRELAISRALRPLPSSPVPLKSSANLRQQLRMRNLRYGCTAICTRDTCSSTATVAFAA